MKTSTWITGKEFKQLMKDCNCVVVRLSNQYQDIEFDHGNTTSVKKLRLDDMDCGSHTFVYQYCNQSDTTIQYLAKSLKPSDELRFYARENGSSLLKEKGLDFIELRARIVTRHKTDMRKDTVSELTVKSEHRIIRN
jgi:hypothetical protein